MGEMPAWYRTILAAKELGVPPWELADKPLIWQEWALTVAHVQNHVQEERAKRSKSKRAGKGK